MSANASGDFQIFTFFVIFFEFIKPEHGHSIFHELEIGQKLV